MSSEFGHQDFNNSDEYEEVNLRKGKNRSQRSFSQREMKIIIPVTDMFYQIVYK